MPDMPGIEEGILRGIYQLQRGAERQSRRFTLFGSGPMLNEALRAQEILAEKYGVQADVWSVTSYNELRREALERRALESAASRSASRRPYIQQVLDGHEGPIVASSEYMKGLSDQLAQWLPGRLEALGTDGFGRSDNREHLRRFFEIDAEHIAGAALSKLSRWNWFDGAKAAAAIRELGLDSEAVNPARR